MKALLVVLAACAANPVEPAAPPQVLSYENDPWAHLRAPCFERLNLDARDLLAAVAGPFDDHIGTCHTVPNSGGLFLVDNVGGDVATLLGRSITIRAEGIEIDGVSIGARTDALLECSAAPITCQSSVCDQRSGNLVVSYRVGHAVTPRLSGAAAIAFLKGKTIEEYTIVPD